MGKSEIKIELLIHDLKVPISVIDAGVKSLLNRLDVYGPLTEKQKKVIKLFWKAVFYRIGQRYRKEKNYNSGKGS